MRTKKKFVSLPKSLGIAMAAIAWLMLVPWPAAAEDLSLEQAVHLALERNERALAAGEQLRAAQGLAAQARSFFFPSISLTGSYTRRPYSVERELSDQVITIQSLNALSGYASLNWILFHPSVIPNYRQALFSERSQRYSSAEIRRRLSFEVASAFLTTLTLDQVHVAAVHRLEYAGKTLEAARARYAAGLVSVNDVTRAELEYATAEMGSTQTQGEVQTAYLQLGYLLDAVVDGKLAPPELLLAQAEMPASAVVELLPGAQERRFDLRSLSWQAKAQQALVLESSLEWLPSLSLTGQYRYTNEAGLTGRSTTWSAGLGFSWTLFDGLGRNGAYKAAKARARIADLDLRGASRQIDLEVRGGLVSLASQQASLKKAQVALDAARKNAAEIAELYRQGLSNALQVADANVNLFEAEVELARQRNGLALALLNLRAAQGLDPFGKEPFL
jgi:outer membrane protein TolC